MNYRLQAIGLVAVLVSFSAAALAQTTTPEPVASPVPSASADPRPVMPRNVPDPSAIPDATAAPSPDATSPATKASLSKRAVHGMLKSLKGTKAILRLADGTTQTFSVSAQTAAVLKKHLGKNAVYRVVDGVLTLAP